MPGGARRVLPGGHGGVLATEALREVVWSFLADREVVASPGLLATGAAGLLAEGLTVVSATLGHAGARADLPLLPVPALPLGAGLP